MTTPDMEALRALRTEVYRSVGCRRDALFAIRDAALTAPVIGSPAHLSLAPTFQRHWGSVYDALNQGTLDGGALHELLMRYPLASTTAWYAVDASVWPRCDAETSPQRGYSHHHTRQSHGQPLVVGWNDSWLVQIPECCSRWTAPQHGRHMLPGETGNQVAAEQSRTLLHHKPFDGTPIVSCDAGYDPVQ